MAASTLVMKFGGTSVGTPEAMRNAIDIVRQAHGEWPHLVVVTSALSGVTDLLLKSMDQAVAGDLDAISQGQRRLREMHAAVIQQLIVDSDRQESVTQTVEQLLSEYADLVRAVAVLGEASPRAADAVASLGERMCVPILAAALSSAGVPSMAVEATRLIVTDDNYQDAHPNIERSTEQTRRELLPLLSEGMTPIVTGFIGATPDGVITTLGRGGSDYSAALIGVALPADEVWIWTDVDGVMSADPRIVPTACTIPSLCFREISELAYYGAKVLHPKTIRPVIEAGIGLRVLNSFNPTHPGTEIVANGVPVGSGIMKAVTAIRNLRLITIEGRGMLGIPGVAAKAFSAVASTKTSVPLITQASSEQSICFAVPSSAAPQVIAALEQKFGDEIRRRDIDRIDASQDVVIITVVGAGMQKTPGVAGRVFNALGEQKVNVIAIAQGSSEVSISLVVDAADEKSALIAIHNLIVEKETV
ncbi:MAG TPA: aspartate kinase [Anaerolineaceae bacterium]|nr:aspartate kinase [Anaerolineaceae bacterium]